MSRPLWLLGHALALAGVVVFVLLGSWQLQRHSDRTGLRDAVAVAAEADPIPIDDADAAYVTVTAEGSFDTELEHLVPRSRDGSSGYAVVVPLVRSDGPGVLVERGWVAIDEEPPPPPDPVRIEGILWPAEAGSIPDELGRFFGRVDPAAIEAFADYPLRSEYLVMTLQDPALGIDPPDERAVGSGPHLGYAGQWFLFAAVVAVGYPALLRRRFGSASTRS